MISTPVLVAVVAFAITYLVKQAYRKPKNFPPGPPSLPIYGAYWIILANCYNNLSTAFSKLGERYKTKIVGMYLANIPAIVVNDPELVKQMLYSEDLDGRMDIILGRVRSYWKKLGLFFTDGYFWHVQRRFSLRYMRDFGFGRRSETLEAVQAAEIREMIDMILNGPKYPAEHTVVKEDLIHLPEVFAVPFINGMLEVFVRMTVPRQDYHVLWELARGGLLFQRSSDDLGRAITLTPWLKDVLPNYSGYNGLRKGNQFFLDFFGKLIEEVKKDHNESYDRHFLDMYIRKMKEEIRRDGKTTFTEEQLQLVCIDYMFPTATALEQVLSMLVEQMLLHPEIQDKIHEEIDRVVGRDRPPTLDDRKNMPYTEACLREMMRFETVVPLGIPHRAMKDTKFAGYDLPEGCLVSANYVPLHTDKQIWGDPENFRPERFIRNGELAVSLDKSLPFGAGRRLCAGETYARHSMFLMLASFMQVFKLSTADGRPYTELAPRIPGIITTIPEFWVKATKREA